MSHLLKSHIIAISWDELQIPAFCFIWCIDFVPVLSVYSLGIVSEPWMLYHVAQDLDRYIIIHVVYTFHQVNPRCYAGPFLLGEFADGGVNADILYISNLNLLKLDHLQIQTHV